MKEPKSDNILGERVRRARVGKRMSQQQLANAVGIAQESILKIERGRTKRSAYLSQIERVLDLPVDSLVNLAPRRSDGHLVTGIEQPTDLRSCLKLAIQCLENAVVILDGRSGAKLRMR
jgi:transcriptional regulator with XRE-family HTH domain